MNYYRDARDILEAAYPTCTTFVRYHRNPTLGETKELVRAILMIISVESKTALERFKHVCYSVENTKAHVHVYDFSGIEEGLPFFSNQGSIHGQGELFWIEHGKIIAVMTKDFDLKRFGELTDKLYQVDS